MPKARTAVLGASGYIGQEFARRLADHPGFETPTLVVGDRSEGRTLSDVWQLAEPPPEAIADVRLVRMTPRRLAERAEAVFSALPSGTAGPIESEIARRGVPVFTNASDHRLDPHVPLLVPEVNPGHLALLRARPRGSAPIVANPNCSAAGLVLALAPVVPLLAPRAVHVTTYQALSGAGIPGVPSISILDNVIPHIPGEEEKIAQESARMLGRLSRGAVRPLEVPFLANCARVGVRDAHLEAVTVEARKRPALSELEAAWRTFDPLADLPLETAPHPPIVLRSELDRPQPLRDRWVGVGRARGMVATVGRVRWAAPYLRFFVLSHNAVRGGAGGSILNAELARAAGYWGAGR